MKKTTLFAVISMAGALSLVAFSGVSAHGDGTQRGERAGGGMAQGTVMHERGERKNVSTEAQMRHRVDQDQNSDKSQNRYEKRHAERGGMQQRNVNREARAAVETNNWEAFKAAVKEKFFGKKIDSQEDFGKLQQAHQLHTDGDYEAARAIMEDLGFERPEKGRGGQGQRFAK